MYRLNLAYLVQGIAPDPLGQYSIFMGALIRAQRALTNAPIKIEYCPSGSGAMPSTSVPLSSSASVEAYEKGCHLGDANCKSELEYGQQDVAFLYGT